MLPCVYPVYQAVVFMLLWQKLWKWRTTGIERISYVYYIRNLVRGITSTVTRLVSRTIVVQCKCGIATDCVYTYDGSAVRPLKLTFLTVYFTMKTTSSITCQISSNAYDSLDIYHLRQYYTVSLIIWLTDNIRWIEYLGFKIKDTAHVRVICVTWKRYRDFIGFCWLLWHVSSWLANVCP